MGLNDFVISTMDLILFLNFLRNSIVRSVCSFKPSWHLIESEVILIEQSLMASGFSEQNAFCLIGGLGKLFLPFLSDKFINTCKPPKGNALQGAIAIAKREFF